MALSGARLVVLVSGLIIAVFGLYLIVLPGGPGTIVGIYTVFIGLALTVGALIERIRYRADPVDRAAAAVGPGGGEPGEEILEPRFRPTTEVFVDPTSGYRMRVWIDPGSGERRYRAEATPDAG